MWREIIFHTHVFISFHKGDTTHRDIHGRGYSRDTDVETYRKVVYCIKSRRMTITMRHTTQGTCTCTQHSNTHNTPIPPFKLSQLRVNEEPERENGAREKSRASGSAQAPSPSGCTCKPKRANKAPPPVTRPIEAHILHLMLMTGS